MASGAVTVITDEYRIGVRQPVSITPLLSALPAPLMAVMEIADRFPITQANISSYREAIPAFLAVVLCQLLTTQIE